jgi:rhomboid protease GluP
MNQSNPTQYDTPPPPVVPGGQPAGLQLFRPYVTYSLLGICVAVFLLQLATQSIYGADIPAVLGAKVNDLILQGQVWRFITPTFLHGSIFHIAFNMYALFYLGTTLERFYRHERFLLLFLLSGFAGNVFSFLFSPHPSLGASTAIFGLLGAEGVLLYQNRELFGNYARRALSQVIMIAVVNLIIGMSPGIDNWGHIGGLIGGTLFAWFGGPLFQRQGFYAPYGVKDVRTNREVIIAGVGVGALFTFLALATMFLRVG